MSGSYFKKVFSAANVQITSHRGGGRSVTDAYMDDDTFNSKNINQREPRIIDRDVGGRNRGGRNRGRGRGGHRDYSQHDDRDKSVTERLGERMGYKNRGRNRKNNRGPRGRGARGGHGGADDDHWSKRHSGPQSAKTHQWYQVTVPFGAQVNKDFIYDSINELLEIPFVPMFYRTEDKAAIFYVEMTLSSIEALKSVNKRITFPNGFKMILIVKSQDPPLPKVIEGEPLEKLLTAMSSCYDPENKVLNLEQFHKQEALKPDFLPLNRNAVMTAAVNIIKEHIPEIVALSLSNNRLSSLVCLEPLVKSTPNLKGLDLSENPELGDRELDRLKGWNLTEINLNGTPMSKRNPDKALYLSAVRKKFPQIIVLDGEEAPPAITIDLEEQEQQGLPDSLGNYFGASQELVTMFVRQYFELFDSDDRSPLIQAYHDNVMFSTSFWFNPHLEKQPSFDVQNSRNLMKIENTAQKAKRLKIGKQTVIDFFTQQFPKTKHLLETLTVDVVSQTPAMMIFSVSGLFEEPNSGRGSNVCRSFNRTFTTVPMGGGIVVISEMLSMSNVSNNGKSRVIQLAKKRSEMPVAPISAPLAAAASAAAPVSSTSTAGVPTIEQQKALVQQVMTATGMNAYWSEECLKSQAWDFTKAGETFISLKAEGKIPPEAFQQ